MRGQAGLEFLMTYGWAVLIVIVVVSALFVMGIFNPDAFTGNYRVIKCNDNIIVWETKSDTYYNITRIDGQSNLTAMRNVIGFECFGEQSDIGTFQDFEEVRQYVLNQGLVLIKNDII